MKKFRILSALMMLVTAIGFISCDSESPTLGNNTGAVDNNDVSLVVASGIGNYDAEDVVATIENGAIVITGSTVSTGQALTMTLNKTRLRLNREYNNVALSYITSTTEYSSANSNGEMSGTIVITSLDKTAKKISGFFSFRGWDTENPSADPVIFYNGKFDNVPYTGSVEPEVLPAVAPGDEYIKAKAGAAAVTAFTTLNREITTGQMLEINGSNTAAPVTSLKLEFPLGIQPGEYPISENSSVKGTYTNETAVYNATEGTLIIESNDEGVVKGKFKFKGVNADGTSTTDITEGEFNIEY